ncbi:MAG: hypothetical protein FWD57_04045 [Polyangiaceae bacterium]|nr:hypothetical protein [Polyangiaceae bacterium]
MLALLGLLIAIVAIAIVIVKTRRQALSPIPQPFEPPPQPAPTRTIRFAAGAFSAKVREIASPENSGEDVFTQATFWWAGTGGDWNDIEKNLGLVKIDQPPSSDGDLLVLVYEASCPVTEMPTSRIAGSMCMGDAARDNSLRYVGMFTISRSGARLTDVGFRR